MRNLRSLLPFVYSAVLTPSSLERVGSKQSKLTLFKTLQSLFWPYLLHVMVLGYQKKDLSCIHDYLKLFWLQKRYCKPSKNNSLSFQDKLGQIYSLTACLQRNQEIIMKAASARWTPWTNRLWNLFYNITHVNWEYLDLGSIHLPGHNLWLGYNLCPKLCPGHNLGHKLCPVG